MERTVILEEYARNSSRRRNVFIKYRTAILFLLPFIAAFVIFFVYPLFFGIVISFTDFKLTAPSVNFNNFEYYIRLFSSTIINSKGKEIANPYAQTFWTSFGHSIIFSIIMVPIAIIVPLTLAILINQKPVGYKVFRCLIYLPAIVPLTAAGSIFILLFMDGTIFGKGGIFGGNTVFFGGGTDVTVLFSIGSFQVSATWLPIFLMCFWGGWGGNFLILTAGLQNVPKSLYEAANIDGASKWKQIVHVTLSGIKPQIVLCLFTTIIGYLGLYGQNFVLNQGGPWYDKKLNTIAAGGNTSTVMYFIQDILANKPSLKNNFYGLAASASLIFAIIVGAISGLQLYLTRDKKSGTKKAEEFSEWQHIM